MSDPARHAPVRPLRRDDLPALRAVIDATGLFPGGMLDAMAEGFLSGAAPDEFWLAAEADGPAGIAYCAPERLADRVWNLLLIAVRPDLQGRGLGSALQRAVEAALEERGERLLLVETSGLPEFEGTRAFYRGLGYAEEARVRDYYRDGDDKVVFAKRLGARR
jgi:ribosomal protein S18 acetylase RimI-like enzyme